MIRVVDLVQHYGIRPVRKRINLEIGAGQVVVCVGPNGMGKAFVAPLLAVALTVGAAGLIQVLNFDPLIVVPVSVACTTMILLGFGPTLVDWRMTGHHRISPSDKSKTLIRI
jgi:ABC-type hemin transport system ATPase subunit